MTKFRSSSLTLCALAGCGSGQDRNAATIKAAATVPTAVNQAKQDLDHVTASLTGLRNAGDGGDLKALYGELKSRASELHGSLSDVASSSERTVAAGKDQITQWHEQADTFTDPGLREASGKREADLRKAVDALAASKATLAGASDSYESRLTQTVKALDLDLSRPGVESVKPIVSKLVDDESGLRNALSDVSDKSAAVNAVIRP